jgi:putative MATE family efflux protein
VPLAVLFYGRAGLKISWPLARFDWPLVRRILRIGIPGGVDTLSVVLLQFVFLALVNHLGQASAAAHGVAIRLESLAYLPGTAFQVAAATLAGQYLGAGNPRQATRVVKVASLWCCALMSSAGVAMYFGAHQLVTWFLGPNQIEVAQMAAPLLQIIAWAMPPLALLMVLTGALRGAGDTRWPLVFTLIGFLLVRMPLAYYLAYVLAFGVRGAWYAMVTDLTVRCLLVVARFTHGGWRRLEV